MIPNHGHLCRASKRGRPSKSAQEGGMDLNIFANQGPREATALLGSNSVVAEGASVNANHLTNGGSSMQQEEITRSRSDHSKQQQSQEARIPANSVRSKRKNSSASRVASDVYYFHNHHGGIKVEIDAGEENKEGGENQEEEEDDEEEEEHEEHEEDVLS